MKKKATDVSVTRQTVSAIQVGKDVYEVVKTSDGRGVNVKNGQGNLFVPNGKAGQAIANEILALTKTTEKRVRRTKAQIEADKASTGDNS